MSPYRFKEKFAMTLIVAVTAGVPCLVLLMLVGVRHLRSLPFAQTLAVARGGDQRGIALQTIIIMVVLLAIAGAVAAVLLTRAGEETANLEDVDSAAYGITNETGCNLGGHSWNAVAAATALPAAGTEIGDGLRRAGVETAGGNHAGGYCAPN